MRLAWGFCRWPKDAPRKRGIRLIGTVPAFGWRWNVGGKSLGIQWSTGLRHGWTILEWGRTTPAKARRSRVEPKAKA